MKRAQVIGIAAGVTVGLVAVALGVALAREEGRASARRWIAQSGEWTQRGSQAAVSAAQQAQRVSAQVAKSAAEQYRVQAPKVQSSVSGLIAQAPSAANALNAALSRTGLNGKGGVTTATTEE